MEAGLIRRLGWGLMAALALFVAGYAFAILAVKAIRPPFLEQRFAIMPFAAVMHFLASAVALAVGPFQHNQRIRSRSLGVHRWLGRIYVIAVLVGGAAAIRLATVSEGGLVSHVGFGMLGALWITATAMAYRHIRAGDQASHRRWMVRSYALTYAAVTLRLYIPLSVVAGIPFEPAYQTVAWLCWVPNLIVAEWLILRQQRARVVRESGSALAA
jgi:uncharacterized membrane protein